VKVRPISLSLLVVSFAASGCGEQQAGPAFSLAAQVQKRKALPPTVAEFLSQVGKLRKTGIFFLTLLKRWLFFDRTW